MAQQTLKKKTQASAPSKDGKAGKREIFPLDPINFVMIGACILLIVIGFALMAGSPNTGSTFNYDIFSTRRTVVGPTIALLGFVLMIFAIIFKKKDKKGGENSADHNAE